jgi:hypothetical protein
MFRQAVRALRSVDQLLLWASLANALSRSGQRNISSSQLVISGELSEDFRKQSH